jgi:hypothetical protein
LYDDNKLDSLASLDRSIDVYRREEHGGREPRAIVSSEHVRNLKYLTIVRSELSRPAIRSLSDSLSHKSSTPQNQGAFFLFRG